MSSLAEWHVPGVARLIEMQDRRDGSQKYLDFFGRCRLPGTRIAIADAAQRKFESKILSSGAIPQATALQYRSKVGL